MESTGKSDKLSKSYSSGAVSCCFLLAPLWPLGNFIFWILAGAISYFVFRISSFLFHISYFFFLSYFHQPKTVNAFREGASNRQKRVSPFQPFLEKLKEKN